MPRVINGEKRAPEEATVLQMKADIKIAIEKEVERQKLSRKKLAQVLDIQHLLISDLLTGRVSKMAINKLVKYAHRLGVNLSLRSSREQS